MGWGGGGGVIRLGGRGSFWPLYAKSYFWSSWGVGFWSRSSGSGGEVYIWLV